MNEWAVFLSVIALCCTIYYWLFRRNYFEENGIVYVKRFQIFGMMTPVILRQGTVWEVLDTFYNTHKEAKYIGFYDKELPVILIRDPSLIKTITVKHFDHFVNHRVFFSSEVEPFFAKNLFVLSGEKWREMRNLLSPAFTSSKMKAMFKLMANCAENFADYLNNQAAHGEFNSKDAFTRFTSDVIATCAFGISTDSMRNPNNEFYILGKTIGSFGSFKLAKLVFMMAFPTLTKHLRLKFFGKRIENFFTEIIKNTVETRDREGIVRPDMIQLMMESRKNEAGKGPNLNIEDMVAQAFIFFLAGFETTATQMSFAAHLIATHPDVQRKLQEEVDEVYEKCEENLTYDAINRMEYLEAVINEAMRLYPVGPPIDRVCTKSFELPPALPGKKPVLLKPGDIITFSSYSLQRDPKYFPNPEEFIPERFIENPEETLHSPAYLPFGIGPRMCLGNRFALLEIKVVLFHLIAKCSLAPGEKTILPIKLDPSSPNMAPKGGFWMSLQPRGKWASKTTKI